MILKILILALVCLIPLQAYTQENGVLILTNDDMSNITEIFPHLFIKYYVPWCKHCNKLAPIFEEIAQELKARNSTIRMAKINCDQNEKAFQFQNLAHFPTLVFYNHGEKLDFDGDRTKNYLLKWLTKRLISPVIEITLEELQKMRASTEDQVSLVFHGELESIKGATFTNTAYQDNYNNYYFIKEHTKPYGVVQLLRSFAEDVELAYPDDDFHYWIWQHDRPAVVPLDIRSISAVFRDEHLGVTIFLQDQHSSILAQFKNAAQQWYRKTKSRSLKFIHVPEDHEDYYGLLEYMDVNPLEAPIVIIDSGNQKKYVMGLEPAKITAQKIVQFLDQYDTGKILSTPLQSENSHHHHHQHDHDHDHQHDHHHHDHHHHHHDHEDHDHDHHGHHHHHHDHHDHDHHHHHHDHVQNKHHHHHDDHEHHSHHGHHDHHDHDHHDHRHHHGHEDHEDHHHHHNDHHDHDHEHHSHHHHDHSHADSHEQEL